MRLPICGRSLQERPTPYGTAASLRRPTGLPGKTWPLLLRPPVSRGARHTLEGADPRVAVDARIRAEACTLHGAVHDHGHPRPVGTLRGCFSVPLATTAASYFTVSNILERYRTTGGFLTG